MKEIWSCCSFIVQRITMTLIFCYFRNNAVRLICRYPVFDGSLFQSVVRWDDGFSFCRVFVLPRHRNECTTSSKYLHLEIFQITHVGIAYWLHASMSLSYNIFKVAHMLPNHQQRLNKASKYPSEYWMSFINILLEDLYLSSRRVKSLILINNVPMRFFL